MKTKKISELTMMETVSDAANVLVEENGEAKRVPAKMMGGGARSWDDLNGKPFYEETTTVSGDTLTWDGNTDGLLTVEIPQMGGAVFVRISDAVPVLDDCHNGIMETYSDGDSQSYSYDVIANNIYPQAGYLATSASHFIPHDNFDFMGMLTLPKAGTWVMYMEGERYVTSITIPNYTGFVTTKTVIKPLDQKFLPEHLQFGETVVMGDTLTWDGNTEGLVSVSTEGTDLYKLSDATPVLEDFSNGGSIVVTVVNSEVVASQEQEFGSSDVICTADGIISAANIVIVPDASLNIEIEELGGVVFTESGTYFFYQELEDECVYVSSFTIPGYTGFPTKTVKPIEKKFIPGELIPVYTAEDEGKVLKIVGGVPTWVSIPSAEEASF